MAGDKLNHTIEIWASATKPETQSIRMRSPLFHVSQPVFQFRDHEAPIVPTVWIIIVVLSPIS